MQTLDFTKFGAVSMMEVRVIGDTGKYYTSGGNGFLYFVDPDDIDNFRPVFDLGTYVAVYKCLLAV